MCWGEGGKNKGCFGGGKTSKLVPVWARELVRAERFVGFKLMGLKWLDPMERVGDLVEVKGCDVDGPNGQVGGRVFS